MKKNVKNPFSVSPAVIKIITLDKNDSRKATNSNQKEHALVSVFFLADFPDRNIMT